MSIPLKSPAAVAPHTRLALVAGIVLPFLFAAGCKDRAQAKVCGAAREESRRAAIAGDLQKARAKLSSARAVCGPDADYDLRRIEELISRSEQRQRQLAERRERESAKDEAEPLRPFVRWIGRHRDDVDGAAENLACAERGSADFGFCEGERREERAAPGAAPVPMSVRFLRADPSAFRFRIRLPVPLTCRDIGNHRVVRTWSRGSTQFSLCELTEYPLQRLTAVVENDATGSQVFILSPQYLSQDGEFRALVQSR
jgi:hypothetical protein